MIHWCTISRRLVLAALLCSPADRAQDRPKSKPPEQKQAAQEAKPAEDGKRIELNLLGKTNTDAGESRRNENIQFNPVDNNALKELNVRLGTTATIISELSPSLNYFGAEFGNVPYQPIAVPSALKSGFHGNLHYAHLNSIFSARSFFQVGGVKPARDNDFGFALGSRLWRNSSFFMDGSQQKLRGNVNGNVLVPKPDERTPLAADPRIRTIVAGWLAAYPTELPNRTDINPRALNTNSQQIINNNNATLRLDQDLGRQGMAYLQYAFTSQNIKAFQLVPGQNPDTDTKYHKARITWNRAWSASTLTDLSIGCDRLRSLLVPEPHAVGPMVSISGLETLGPQGEIPIDRTQNLFRYAGQVRTARGKHGLSAGFSLTRRQHNGIETDAHRGFWGFVADFGHDAITNLRLGLPSQYIIALGNVSRGFRNWDLAYYAGDDWRVTSGLTLQFGVRYEPSPTPAEVNGRNTIPYGCDCNNVAPRFGLAKRLPHRWGTVRTSYGLHYGQIFPVTFQQVRFSPPGSEKLVVLTPDLNDPMRGLTQGGENPNALGNLYLLSPDLVVPYAHQYNISWEPDWSKSWKLQLGYVGSRSHKLLVMWYLNRAHPVTGIPQTTATINERRADPTHAEKRLVVNGSRGYYDAARVSFIVPFYRGFSMSASYWFSKAIDMGSSYTNTAYAQDSRLSRSQSESENQHDMRELSSFDQPHAFLCNMSYRIPFPSEWARANRIAGGWRLSAVVLAKSGTPFTVVASDGPGYGNVDGNGGDRPNLLDPRVLSRTIGNPDTSAQLLPRSAFGFMQPTDERGNLGRNTFRKGGIRNVNAALWREWEAGRGTAVSFRAESINLFNTPQFAEPGTDPSTQNFAHITNTLNDGRTFRFRIQLAW